MADTATLGATLTLPRACMLLRKSRDQVKRLLYIGRLRGDLRDGEYAIDTASVLEELQRQQSGLGEQATA